MKICHVCKVECEDNAELCHVCGADLSEIAPQITEETTEEILEIKNPVLLASIEDVVSAEIFKDILNDSGILYSCSEPNEEGIKVVFGGGLISEDIYVDEKDFEIAERLYAEFLASEEQFEDEFFIEEFEENEDTES